MTEKQLAKIAMEMSKSNLTTAIVKRALLEINKDKISIDRLGEYGSIKSAMRQFPISIANRAAIKLDHVVWPWIKLREAIPIFSKTKTNALKQYAWLKREQADRIKDIYRGLANKQPVGGMI